MPFILQIILIFSLIGFILQILLEYIKTIRVMLFAGSLLGIVICTLAIAFLSLPKPQPHFPYSTVDHPSEKAAAYQFTEEEYSALISKYHYLISVQPSDRDLLINLSLLYQAQNNDQKVQEFSLAAQKLDPNNPFFSL